jgi:hypothetical protein
MVYWLFISLRLLLHTLSNIDNKMTVVEEARFDVLFRKVPGENGKTTTLMTFVNDQRTETENLSHLRRDVPSLKEISL